MPGPLEPQRSSDEHTAIGRVRLSFHPPEMDGPPEGQLEECGKEPL